MTKQRLSATVEAGFIEAAEEAVSRGEYESVSAWVNDALRLKLDHERRLEALAAFVAQYETGHGEITADEMNQAIRNA
jgi:Arc/MetJ-type ribon-helix-helix transcriptional regulator